MPNRIEEYMGIVNWLNGYRRALFRIERLKEEVLRWQAKAQKTTPAVSPVAGARGDGTPAAVLALEMAEAAEARLAEAKLGCSEKRAEIEKAIARLPRENQQKVLYCLYIDLLEQKAVAAQLHYSRKQISRIHMAALDELEKMSPHVP